jgi:gamma-D-glutamyl-L-lysine dipeptidyl-peptidase
LGLDETVHAGEAIDGAQRARRFPPNASAITESALTYYSGTSYVWGGVTPWGADCSGLVQSVFSLHGVQLPRDAWMQARSGVDNGRDLLSAQVGDLLFFTDATDGEVTHVGLALGNARMVHLALARGGFWVERLDDPRDEYVAKLRDRYLFSRSVI